ncbi:hypothetical protein M0812_19636 [Anaeramoeba flamelloides]|uniref:Uncharacterized protein n=1 Tax=Anaeramoeba flamelloides TaxID=1746091 RepID=A0AAV7Z0E3_9EUKA|nr:hypothetical protein M0812_19636 [Anaeramoeba flamelloides]
MSYSFLLLGLVQIVYFSLVIVNEIGIKFEDFSRKGCKFTISRRQLKWILIINNILILIVSIMAFIVVSSNCESSGMQRIQRYKVWMDFMILMVGMVWTGIGTYYYRNALIIIRNIPNYKDLPIYKMIRIYLYSSAVALLFMTVALICGIIDEEIRNEGYKCFFFNLSYACSFPILFLEYALLIYGRSKTEMNNPK